MRSTHLVQARVKLITEADGKIHLYEMPSYRRLATEASEAEALACAADNRWYVVNPPIKEVA
jgi:hypothetical protein